jgi:hypothetical protein
VSQIRKERQKKVESDCPLVCFEQYERVWIGRRVFAAVTPQGTDTARKIWNPDPYSLKLKAKLFLYLSITAMER